MIVIPGVVIGSWAGSCSTKSIPVLDYLRSSSMEPVGESDLLQIVSCSSTVGSKSRSAPVTFVPSILASGSTRPFSQKSGAKALLQASKELGGSC